MGRPRLLDLFCGAGGCSVGYRRAGFDVVGIDVVRQPRYPFPFVQGDALGVMERLLAGGFGIMDAEGRCYGLDDFAAIHASPPCQAFSQASRCTYNRKDHPDLVGVMRDALVRTGLPYVIENVPGAPLLRGSSVMLCGLMFGLKVLRHRWFESPVMLLTPAHPSHRGKVIGVGGMCCVAGHGGGKQEKRGRHGHGGQQPKAGWCVAMGIDWMTRDELAQAIPPAYTEYLGRQLLDRVRPGGGDDHGERAG